MNSHRGYPPGTEFSYNPTYFSCAKGESMNALVRSWKCRRNNLAVCLLAGAALYVTLSTSAVAGTIIIGLPPDPDTGDCAPFSCDYDGVYQQVYTSSQFRGPITIYGLDFYNTVPIPGRPGPVQVRSLSHSPVLQRTGIR